MLSVLAAFVAKLLDLQLLLLMFVLFGSVVLLAALTTL
jgi:hypothetical protein